MDMFDLLVILISFVTHEYLLHLVIAAVLRHKFSYVDVAVPDVDVEF